MTDVVSEGTEVQVARGGSNMKLEQLRTAALEAYRNTPAEKRRFSVNETSVIQPDNSPEITPLQNVQFGQHAIGVRLPREHGIETSPIQFNRDGKIVFGGLNQTVVTLAIPEIGTIAAPTVTATTLHCPPSPLGGSSYCSADAFARNGQIAGVATYFAPNGVEHRGLVKWRDEHSAPEPINILNGRSLSGGQTSISNDGTVFYNGSVYLQGSNRFTEWARVLSFAEGTQRELIEVGGERVTGAGPISIGGTAIPASLERRPALIHVNRDGFTATKLDVPTQTGELAGARAVLAEATGISSSPDQGRQPLARESHDYVTGIIHYDTGGSAAIASGVYWRKGANGSYSAHAIPFGRERDNGHSKTKFVPSDPYFATSNGLIFGEGSHRTVPYFTTSPDNNETFVYADGAKHPVPLRNVLRAMNAPLEDRENYILGVDTKRSSDGKATLAVGHLVGDGTKVTAVNLDKLKEMALALGNRE